MGVSQTYKQSLRNEATINGARVRFLGINLGFRDHGISRQVRVLTVLLMRGPHEWVTVADMLDYVYPEADGGPIDADDSIWQAIAALRERGVTIESRWGPLYRIPAEARA